jgi:capsular exopolysaccharide synthesis family protein
LLGVVPLPGKAAALALSDPRAAGSEAHHAIFVALERLARTADQRVLLLTSSGPSEGKTMIAFKLSASFAAAGKKVLVIDTDMRRGSLHQLLGLPNQPGLSDLLARDWAYRLTDVAHHCADRGFSVLPRGESATDPAELLASRRFAELLDDAANLYDMVIMDGPPVLGLADALRLSGMADATVFVVRANQTLPEHAKLAMRRLSEAGAEQIGLVITEPDLAADPGAPETADSCQPAVDAAKLAVAEVAPHAEPAPAQPIDRPGKQEGPALPSPWVSWLLQQQEGARNAG